MATLILAGCATAPTADRPPQSGKRNVILFLGDGMGVSTVTAGRILAGQLKGERGEEHVLSFETFPNVALVKTYNTDSQVSDSAGTMSAIVTGRKTRIGVLSVTPFVERNDCAKALEESLPTLLEKAEHRGLATGVISTARITHATPAATYAHSPNRDWESNAMLPELAVAAGCRDIARQLVEFEYGDGIDVILGGGRAPFLPADESDSEYPDRKGVRTDGANLIEQWQAGAPARQYVWSNSQLQAITDPRAQVMGLFEPSHMQFEADRADDPAGEPSLAEMTAFAIERLQQDNDGFFLMVEGGRIDHAHHAGNAYRALHDVIAFAEAVQQAMDMTNPEETLILVTADHSHTLTISGYPRRGNPILGKVMTALGDYARDSAGQPYTTLTYANGPGHRATAVDLREVDTEAPNYRQDAAVPMGSETHGGEDVPAYARGPNADTLRGVIEQERLYDVMDKALFGRRD